MAADFVLDWLFHLVKAPIASATNSFLSVLLYDLSGRAIQLSRCRRWVFVRFRDRNYVNTNDEYWSNFFLYPETKRTNPLRAGLRAQGKLQCIERLGPRVVNVAYLIWILLQKSATAVAYCKRGRGNLRVNGRPLELVEPRVLQYKLQEPILLLGKVRQGTNDYSFSQSWRERWGGQWDGNYHTNLSRLVICSVMFYSYSEHDDAIHD